MCKCVPDGEIRSILTFCHSYTCSGHYGGYRIVTKVLQCGFFWPTLFCEVHRFCLACKHCQHTGALFHCDMMPLSPILIVEIFDVWGLDFLVPFSHPLALFTYWLLWIMCQSGCKLKLLGPMTTRLWSGLWNSAYFVDMGTLEPLLVMEIVIFHRSVETLLRKYSVTYKVSTSYYPKISCQVEVSNREIK